MGGVTPAERLIGAWSLLSYRIEDGAGRTIDEPFGSDPIGMLVYTEGGEVSVHAMARGRARCGTRRPVECARDAKIAAYDSYFGYSGTYTLDGDVVAHHVTASCFPDWTGTVLRRRVTVAGRQLVLRGVGPHAPSPRVPVLLWTPRQGDT
jgi:hypothetical protein